MRFQVPVDPDHEKPTDFSLDPILYSGSSNTEVQNFPIQSAANYDFFAQVGELYL